MLTAMLVLTLPPAVVTTMVLVPVAVNVCEGKTICVAMLLVGVTALPSTVTVAELRFAPLIVIVPVAAPTNAVVGEILVMLGAPGPAVLIVKVTPLLVSPSATLRTVTVAIPAVVTNADGTVAVTCPAFT